MVRNLSLTTITEMDDGRMRAAMDMAITQCLDDIEDRGHDEKPRTVTLKMTLTPEVDGGKNPEGVAIDFDIESKMPPRRSKTYRAELKRNARGTQALFNDVSPDDPKQATLDDVKKPKA